jgi:hypothetical protein
MIVMQLATSHGGTMRFAAKIRRFALPVALSLTGAMLCFAIGNALEPPRVIPHSAPVNKPVGDVFHILKTYFSDRVQSKFQTVNANEEAATIVAKQTGIDNLRWREWATCQTDAVHMLYQLNDAIVTLTIKLEQAPRNTTFMTVSADFRGIYGLAQDETTIECRSTGALEDNILALAGAEKHGGAASPPAP